MSKKSPEDLDKLFQQEPEQYPYAYNETSWDEMEKLLDKDDQRRFLWWWIFGIGALVLIGSFLFFGKNETEVVDANLDFDKKEMVETETETKTQTQTSTSNSNENQTSNLEAESQVLASKDLNENNQSNSNLILNKNESNISNTKKTTSDKPFQQYNYKNKKEDLSPTFDDVGFRENQILSDSAFEKKNTAEENLSLKNTDPKVEEKDSVNILLQSKSVFPIASLNIFLPEEKEIFTIPLLKEKIEGVPVENKNILLLGLIIGGESTATNRDDFSQPNWKIGGLLEYRFLERFSASVGANFVRKKYGARGSDYKPDAEPWLYDVAPTSVDASCDILEIPVSIGFFQKKNNQNGFYSKLGLTSIFMLEEHYWYFYDQEIPGQIKYWGGENENQHWFGIGELSVGYQQYITHRTSVQIEPFVQIPLAGVGNGNVKLWSVGVNMKFNFQVNKRFLKSPLKK